MNIRFFLIRHVESMKNTLNTYASLDGKEPITQYGRLQANDIATFLERILNSYCFEEIRLFSAGDLRSYCTASTIAKKMGISLEINNDLASFVGASSAGKPAPTLYSDNIELGKKIQLYRAGLISAYDVPWPAGNTSSLEKKLLRFLNSYDSQHTPVSIIVSHKSVITCLSILLMRKYCNYPKDFYGYIDIPVGHGFLIEISENNIDVSLLDFSENDKTIKTDVILRDGTIIFPESSCAVCWNNNSLLLVKQLRKGKISYELPGGKINSLESAVAAAQRELFEETGYISNGGKVLYSLDLDLSVSVHRTHLVAFDTFSKTNSGEFEAEWVPSTTLEKMINDGIITHAPTLVSFFSRINNSDESQGGFRI